MRLDKNKTYPYLHFYRSRMTGEVFAVQINNYNESTSMYGFENLQTKASYKLCYEKKIGLSAYNGCYYKEDEVELKIMKENHPNEPMHVNKWKRIEDSIDNNRYHIYDFFLKIGFDKKTKKINGKTWNKHLKDAAKEIPVNNF